MSAVRFRNETESRVSLYIDINNIYVIYVHT